MSLILVVDDNPDVRYLLRRILEDAGFGVTEAANGAAALEVLDDEEAGADLVILDVQMPGMTGWQTLEQIRKRDPAARVPVVMCTVRGSPDSVKRGYALGCDGYLAKPFDVDQVPEVVRQALAAAG